jgi:hypothetical protein
VGYKLQHQTFEALPIPFTNNNTKQNPLMTGIRANCITTKRQAKNVINSNMATSGSTIYPKLQAADPSRPSLADFPLEIVLQIIEALFNPEQIIIISVFSNEEEESQFLDSEGEADPPSTEVILHAPPLNKTSAISRLFRHIYRRSRPTLWSAHLTRGQAYYLDPARDIFYLRTHEPHWFDLWPPNQCLAGLDKLAVQRDDEKYPGSLLSALLTLNERCKELLFITSVRDLEGDTLNLAPLLLPMEDNYEIQDGKKPIHTWGVYKKCLVLSLRLRKTITDILSGNGKLWPLPDVKGSMVDERRLGGPDNRDHYSGN